MSALQAAGVSVQRGGRRVLDAVDLRVDAGALTAIVGPNGAGKSTLLAALLGWVPLTAGSVRVGGDDPHALSPRDRAARLAWLPQRPAVDEAMPVVEVVAAARFRFDEPVAMRHAAARDALTAVGAAHLADRSATALSGGEAQRVALAGLWAQEAAVWLLDEPANHLDPRVQWEVLDLLLDRWRAGHTLVMVVHDLDLLAARVLPQETVAVVALADGVRAWRRTLDAADLPAQLSALYGVRVTGVQVASRRRLLVLP